MGKKRNEVVFARVVHRPAWHQLVNFIENGTTLLDEWHTENWGIILALLFTWSRQKGRPKETSPNPGGTLPTTELSNNPSTTRNRKWAENNPLAKANRRDQSAISIAKAKYKAATPDFADLPAEVQRQQLQEVAEKEIKRRYVIYNILIDKSIDTDDFI